MQVGIDKQSRQSMSFFFFPPVRRCLPVGATLSQLQSKNDYREYNTAF